MFRITDEQDHALAPAAAGQHGSASGLTRDCDARRAEHRPDGPLRCPRRTPSTGGSSGSSCALAVDLPRDRGARASRARASSTLDPGRRGRRRSGQRSTPAEVSEPVCARRPLLRRAIASGESASITWIAHRHRRRSASSVPRPRAAPHARRRGRSPDAATTRVGLDERGDVARARRRRSRPRAPGPSGAATAPTEPRRAARPFAGGAWQMTRTLAAHGGRPRANAIDVVELPASRSNSAARDEARAAGSRATASPRRASPAPARAPRRPAGGAARARTPPSTNSSSEAAPTAMCSRSRGRRSLTRSRRSRARSCGRAALRRRTGAAAGTARTSGCRGPRAGRP